MKNPAVRNLVLIWLGWGIVVLLFQHWTVMRLQPESPDHVLIWTAGETTPGGHSRQPYLLEPFMNEQVAWDSEYYLSIATVGYDDPDIRAIPADFTWVGPRAGQFCVSGHDATCFSLSYAFFPFYSLVTRVVAFPLRLFGLTPIAASTLAGVIVSLLGALGAALGLYFMSRDALGEDGGMRAAFYLLIFPSGFFLAQVYTEGTFLGLCFGTLAFLHYRKWWQAALLAVLAVWTRPGGAILLLPMAVIWFKDKPWESDWKSALLRGLAAASPAISYGIWMLTPLAAKFHLVEDIFFSRGLLALGPSVAAWGQAIQSLSGDNPQTRFYYGLEFIALLLAFYACIRLLKERPELALFGLAMVVFAATSGSAQGMVRYVLVAPPLFWILAKWGKQPAFDRIWTVLSVLLLGLEAMLFSFNFWVA
jgi:hypothetical protein